MDQNKINFIVVETTELHDKTAELYEALIDKEDEEAVSVIDEIRKRLLIIRKDLTNEV